jgi:hypothetical protein
MERKTILFTNSQGHQFVILHEVGSSAMLMRVEGPKFKVGEVVVTRNLNKEEGSWGYGKYFGNEGDAMIKAYKYIYGMSAIIETLADGEE